MEDLAPYGSQPPPPPGLADGRFHSFDPNLIPVSRVGMAVSALIFLGVLFLGLLIMTPIPGIPPGMRRTAWSLWIGLFPVLAVYCWVWPPIAYRHAFYCLKEDALILRRGVFWKTETLVPKSRIQHTDISQGPLQRSYRISDLIIHTAGTRDSLVGVGGLPQEFAPRLRDHLLDRSDDDTL